MMANVSRAIINKTFDAMFFYRLTKVVYKLALTNDKEGGKAGESNFDKNGLAR